jgi:hypothetical protein
MKLLAHPWSVASLARADAVGTADLTFPGRVPDMTQLGNRTDE